MALTLTAAVDPAQLSWTPQEFNRLRVDTVVDARTLRELYLAAFERAVTGAQPWTIMRHVTDPQLHRPAYLRTW